MSRDVEDLNRRVLRARDAMDRAYAEPLNVRAVAAVAHISEAHFIRSFRAVFGETPHRLFREIVGETPSAYRVGNGPIVAPNCVQMAATRPRVAAGVAMRSSSFGEAAAAAAP